MLWIHTGNKIRLMTLTHTPIFKLRLGALISRSVWWSVGRSVLQKLQKYYKTLQNIVGDIIRRRQRCHRRRGTLWIVL